MYQEAADIDHIIIDENHLKDRVAELGAEISRDYQGEAILLVGILKGAVIFMADLARAIQCPISIDFMAVSSYGNQTESQGVVRFIKDLDDPIENKHVLLVEDIIDSGLTLNYVIEHLKLKNPASLKICALLDKSRSREKVVKVDYTGFYVPNEFVVGYGLDYAQRYRTLPYIGVLKPQIYMS